MNWEGKSVMSNTNKHAFLVMAHTQPDLLMRLLKRLDHEKVDIFLHLDKKSDINIEDINVLCKSNLFITERIRVSWGAYSCVQAEYLLLKEATSKGSYCHYHLISGQDCLLQNIEKILDYYDSNHDTNFISFKNDEIDYYIDRLKWNYHFQEFVGRKHGVLYFLQSLLIKMQKAVNRERTIPDNVSFGSMYYDITDGFARWIVDNYNDWKPYFTNTVCPDEFFIQTLFSTYLKEHDGKLCHQEEEDYQTINRAEMSICRAIDWKRGHPYIWTEDDYDMLRSSGLFFARKVDAVKSKALLDILDETKG